jgi:hypothetical protein
LLQVISITVFEKMPLQSALFAGAYQSDRATSLWGITRAVASGGMSSAADEIWKLRDGAGAADAESAKIVTKGNAELPACLGEPEKRVAAVATDVAVGSAADVAFGHLATDVVFRSIGV